MTMADIHFLRKKAAQIRMDLMRMVYEAKTGHTGSSLSETDILTVLYYSILRCDPANPDWEERDRFIQSKGHAVEALYCILADRGYFPKKELKTFSQFGSPFIGHPNRKVPGIEMNTGALGHGLAVGVGMALSAKLDHKDYHVYVLMGDGEQAEGSVWEAAMAAANFNLDNLTGIIDRNKLQISGRTEDVMRLEPLGDKWRSFGWDVLEADGHDMAQLQDVLSTPRQDKKPRLVMAHTTKGKGVSFMENAAHWHHGVPTDEQYRQAMAELGREADTDE